MELLKKNKKKILIGMGIIIAAIVVIMLGALLRVATSKGEKISLQPMSEVQRQLEVPEGYIGITTADELKAISNDLTAKYILMADIDMTGVEWVPIGDGSTRFQGIFDGNTHTISNLTINSDLQYVGMFGYTNGATIQNLTLDNVNVTSSYIDNTAYIGGLIGYDKEGNISHINLTGKIQNTELMEKNVYIGGLVGYHYHTKDDKEGYNTCPSNIDNIIAEVEIIANTTVGTIDAGGLIGYSHGAVGRSSASGNVRVNSTSGTINAGGLIGFLQGETAKGLTTTTGAVYWSNSTGNVIANTTTGTINAGGLVGQQLQGHIGYSYSMSDTTVSSTSGTIYVGGLIGKGGKLSVSYATGNVISNSMSAQSCAGGLIGKADTVSLGYAYSTTNISANRGYVGGLIGYCSGYINETYAVGKIEGGNTKGGLIGNRSRLFSTEFILVSRNNRSI